MVATILDIKKHNNLYRVELNLYNQTLYMVTLGLERNIKVGSRVKLSIPPAQIAIAKDFSGEISYSNILNSTIVSIKNGKILNSITLTIGKTTLEAITSSDIKLKAGDNIKALLKATELSIVEVLDD